MARYTEEQKDVIEKVKIYLKCMRELKNERFSLQLEYDDLMTPRSPSLSIEEHGGYSIPKEYQLDSYIIRKDLILNKLELINAEIDSFIPYTYLLTSGQRNIVNCFINSRGYSDMIDMLYKNHYIDEKAYIRAIPKICLELSKYIDYNNPPRIEDLNRKFNEYMKSISY